MPEQRIPEYYPNPDDVKDPARLERVIRLLFTQVYEMEARIRMLEAALKAAKK